MGIINVIKEITWLTALVLLAMVAFNGPVSQLSEQNNSQATQAFQVGQALDDIGTQLQAGTIALFDGEELNAPEPATVEDAVQETVKIASQIGDNSIRIR